MPRPDVPLHTPPAHDPRTAAVVGAGVAGAAIANALASRGTVVTVLEKHRAAGSGASGNAGAVVRPFLARDARDALARFYSDAARYAFGRLNALSDTAQTRLGIHKGAHWEHPDAGALNPQGHTALPLDQADTRSVIGHTAQSGLWLPDALSLSPARLCHDWLAHPNISVQYGWDLGQLSSNSEGCTLSDRTGRSHINAGVAVLACGVSQANWIPAPPGGLHNTWGLSATLQGDTGLTASLLSPLALTPIASGTVLNTGHWRHRVTVSEALSTVNLPGWLAPHSCVAARLAQRLHTPDRLPMVGAVPDIEETLMRLTPVGQGRPPLAPPAYRPNQYAIGALGGRGVTSALWTAELLARAIYGESDTLEAIHPLRFWVRAVRRGHRLA